MSRFSAGLSSSVNVSLEPKYKNYVLKHTKISSMMFSHMKNLAGVYGWFWYW